ncbi:hypothetical protein [Fibrobacter sp. UWB12]|uniref:hypothetical protein n=1 Tax=Fibrobacter sp. UWB12 TaxID=1896203 RepID=UPI000919BEF3|nr:hypothetical protein [Fibrobacter sp. UWB12]SHK36380.1 hypothetical protein SAMN05720759_102127 [Fibrobacter sp. UWB12]
MDSFDKLVIVIIAIIVDQVIKRAKAKKKQSQQEQTSPYAPEEDSTQETEDDVNDDYDENSEDFPKPSPSASRRLQEYIKQFEEAQREASQGTLEPAMPPPIPERTHRVGNNVTMREVAEDIVQLDVVDIEYLMEEFEMSKGCAIEILNELQQHRIIGHDMGDGEYDVLVQDIDELNNLLSRELKAAPMTAERSAAAPAVDAQSSTSSDKQSQLKILEERARRAREEAAAAARQSDRENGYSGEAVEIADPLTKRTAVRSISRESVRRGFIWGKIIDEPRFKRRWSPARR